MPISFLISSRLAGISIVPMLKIPQEYLAIEALSTKIYTSKDTVGNSMGFYVT